MLDSNCQITRDERLLATAIYVLSFIFPILGPLIIWLLKKDESDFVDFHGREYFNLFISYTVYGIISGILVILLVGILLLKIVGIGLAIFTIIGAVKAFDGEMYRMPFIFRLLK